MDNVQNGVSYINIPSSQTYRSYCVYYFIRWYVCLEMYNFF
jgi:hypothetical protein